MIAGKRCRHSGDHDSVRFTQQLARFVAHASHCVDNYVKSATVYYGVIITLSSVDFRAVVRAPGSGEFELRNQRFAVRLRIIKRLYF